MTVQGGEEALRVSPSPFAEDVQAVAELAFLQVADEAVDPRDRLGRRGVGGKAKVGGDARGAASSRIDGDQAGAAGGVEAVGGGVFVEEAFEALEFGRDCALRQWRRQVAEGDGADAALGLRRLAGVVDDEGVDDWQGADQRLGPAGVGQGDRLAGQPFQRAVRAHVDQGVEALRAEPEVEGDIGVARGAGEVVVVVVPAARPRRVRVAGR